MLVPTRMKINALALSGKLYKEKCCKTNSLHI